MVHTQNVSFPLPLPLLDDRMTTHAKSLVQSSCWIESVLNFFKYVILMCWSSFPYIQNFPHSTCLCCNFILDSCHETWIYVLFCLNLLLNPSQECLVQFTCFYLRFTAIPWIMTISIMSNRNYDQNFLKKMLIQTAIKITLTFHFEPHF